jgi:hypothetical protein
MAVYVPILKGREGEFRAVAHLAPALVPQVLPIFEVSPSDAGPTKDAYQFVVKARDFLPGGLAVAVDVGYLDDPADGLRRPLRDIAEDLAASAIPMLPVVHLYDSPQRMGDVGYAADLHSGHAVVRLGSGTADPDDEEAESQLNRLRDHAGLAVEDCALVLDFFEVRSERDVTRVEPIIRKCVSWAQRYRWQSITVAAGAMPQSISQLPTNQATPIRRWDALLWGRVRELGVQYGDYGIAHPTMAGKGWRPMPNVRYTADDVWWIYRWTSDGNGIAAVCDLCKAIVAADHWPSLGRTFSWGDAEIAARAGGMGRPGNATSWRAWGTSHHLAQVVDQLRRAG